MAEEVNVALADGRTILAQPIKGGWTGGTRERPYPDFAELPGKEPMSNTGVNSQTRVRLERNEYYAQMVKLIARRSTCLRGQVGCLAVQDKRVVATGYNGSPPGARHCLEVGCDIPEADPNAGCQRTIHAESNLVAWAARAGIQLSGAEVWSTHSPCQKCALLLVQAGIETFTYIRNYRLARPDLLADAGILVQVWDDELMEWHPITHGF